MQRIQANTTLFDQTHRNKKSAEINVIEDPKSVNESFWVRGLIKNGFEIWEGTSGDDLIIGNQERTNFIYAQWGDDVLLVETALITLLRDQVPIL